MIPKCIALCGANGIRYCPPHRSRLAQFARPQLQANQDAKCLLGGAAGCTTTANCLRNGGCLRQQPGRIFGNHVNPTLDQGQHGFNVVEGLVLRLGALGKEGTAFESTAKRIRIIWIKFCCQILDASVVNGNLAGVSNHLINNVLAKPFAVLEQAGVGQLSHD